MGIISGLFGLASQADAESVANQLKEILIEGETVEAAFAFVRDKIVFTNLRLILVDKTGVTGSKTNFRSIPYTRITAFSAETQGFMDLDAELELWVNGHAEPVRLDMRGTVPIRDVYRVLGHFVLRG